MYALARGLRKAFRETFGIHNTTTIYNPIDQFYIKQMASKFKIYDQDQLPQGKLRHGYLLHVGSFKAQKAHDVLIKAYAKSQPTKPLLLVGKGALIEAIQSLVRELGLQKCILFRISC